MASRQLEMSWWTLGKLLQTIQDERVPMAMGLSYTEWVRKYLVCSYSKSARALASFRAVRSLPEATVLLLGEGKAKQLARPAVQELSREKREALVQRATDGNESLGAFTAVVRKEIGETKDAWVTWRVPLAIEEQLEAAIEKIARIFGIDLVENPDRRVLCLEYMAGIVDGLDEETLKTMLVGSD